MDRLHSHKNILLKKLKSRPEYVGYYLEKYCDSGDISREDLLETLECTEEDFVKLALCKLAPPFSPEFAGSIDKISKYVEINDLSLSQIIKKVAISEKQKKGRVVEIPPKRNLMAAREKEQKERQEGKDEKEE